MGERLQLRIGNDHLLDTGGDHMREHRFDHQPVAAEGVRETCLTELIEGIGTLAVVLAGGPCALDPLAEKRLDDRS